MVLWGVYRFYSLTEVYFLGFSWGFKEGGTETHTNRTVVRAAGRPGTAKAVLFSLGFLPKSQKKCIVLNERKICNGKYKGLAIQYHFHDCFENSREICIQYIFHDGLNLHKETTYFLSTIGDDGSRQ